MNPEEPEASCDSPIHQWRLLKVADSIDVQGHPVVSHQHFTRCFGVDGICIVKQCGAEETRNVEQGPECHDGEYVS